MGEGTSIESTEQTPKLEVVFGIDREIERINSTIAKLPWYREQGYSNVHTNLPKQLSESSGVEDVTNTVSAEFSDEKYNDFSNYIKEEWEAVSKELEKLREIYGFKLLDNYTLTLTKYGSGGSYNSNHGEVIVNIEFRTREKIIGIIIHEIVHIGIQHLIEKYAVKHWYKERLVDLLVDKLFPDLKRMQKINEDTTDVDEAFNKFFPDLEKIIIAIRARGVLN
ncbi:MAG: hypothetical protein ACYC1K_00450 [Minisyncoccota bacterium]